VPGGEHQDPGQQAEDGVDDGGRGGRHAHGSTAGDDDDRQAGGHDQPACAARGGIRGPREWPGRRLGTGRFGSEGGSGRSQVGTGPRREHAAHSEVEFGLGEQTRGKRGPEHPHYLLTIRV